MNLLLLAGVSLGLFSGPSENDSIYKKYEIPEVIVYANKEGHNIRRLPVSATALTSVSLQQKNIQSIKDVTGFVPNLYMPDYGSKLTSPVYVRGIGSRINAPSVGLYIDNIPYFEKSAFDFDFMETERIEVLRGSQGTLYGRNTMGGVIRVVSKMPLDHNGTYISTGTGNYNTIEASGAHYASLSNKVGFSISGQYKHNGGYFKNNYTGKYADKMNAGAGRMRWRFKPDSTWDINLIASYENSDQDGYPYATYYPAENKTDPVNYNDKSVYKREMSSNGLTIKKEAGRVIINSRTSYQFLSDRQGVDQDFTAQDMYYAIQTQRQNTLSQEFELRSAPDKWKDVEWLTGIFGFYQGMKSDVAVYYKEGAPVPGVPYNTLSKFDFPTYGAALYHQSVIRGIPADNFALTLGLRYDYEKAETDYNAFRTQAGVTSPTLDFKSDLSFHQFSPKVALQYEIDRNNIIYTSVTKGYKTGGFNTSFEREEDRSFDPEYSWTYETGVKLTSAQIPWSAELSVFYIDWRKQQIYQPIPSGRGNMLKNAGKSASKGMEMAIRGRVLPGLQLDAAYGYTYATFRKYKPNDNDDYSGNFLPLVPRYTLTGGGNYTYNLNASGRENLVFGMQYIGTGRIFWNERNDAKQPYYGLLNGSITYNHNNIGYELWMKNINSASYNAYYFASLGSHYVQKGRPFTIGARVRYSF